MTTSNDHPLMDEGAPPVPSNAISSSGAAEQPAPRPRRRLTFFRLGCLTVVVMLGAYVAFLVVLSQSFRECFPPRTIQRDVEQPAVISLDSAHPVAIQRVHVALTKDALPPAGRPGAASLHVRAPVAVQPSPSSSRSQRPAAQPAVLVSFIDDATGQTIASLHHDDLGGGSPLGDRPVELVLDCQPGAACARDIRIVVVLADPALTPTPVEVAWVAGIDVSYEPVGCAGPSYDAVAISAGPPTSLAAADFAFSTAAAQATDATLVVRQVTVSSASAPSTAWLRVSLARTSSFWLPWLLVLPADGGPPVFDQVVGRSFAGTREAVDVPVLAACPTGYPCSARYWLVVRGIPLSGPYDTTWGEPEGFGVAQLGLAAFAVGRGQANGPGVDIAVDAASDGPDVTGDPIAITDELATPLEPDAPRAFDVHIHVPERAASATAPDPWLTGYVVVRVFAPSSGIGARLEGDGALPIAAGVGGYSSLAAAPFATCPAAGPCDLDLTIVGEYASSASYQIISPKPALAARVYVVGGPAGVTATVDPVKDLPHPNAGPLSPLSLPITVAATIAGLAVFVVLVRRRRSRAPIGAAPGSGAPPD